MPWFCCDDCGDSIKKPKIAAHNARCSARSYTCIDCSLVFDQRSVQGHTQCVTEHEKYAQGATKPGGYAEKGFKAATGQQQPGAAAGQAEGLQFLTTRAPWKCNLCNVSCTSQETLMSHAQGVKHKRKSRAVLAAQNGGSTTPQQQQQQDGGEKKETEESEQPPAAAAAPLEADGKKKEKRKSDADADETEDRPSSKKSKKSKKKDAGSEDGAEETTTTATTGVAASEKKQKAPKWKKLAAAHLEKNGGSMKLKKLLAAMMKEAGVLEDDKASEAALEKIKESKKFVIEGKTVKLSGDE